MLKCSMNKELCVVLGGLYSSVCVEFMVVLMLTKWVFIKKPNYVKCLKTCGTSKQKQNKLKYKTIKCTLREQK